MWFDPAAALAEMRAAPATIATTATILTKVAEVAVVAAQTPPSAVPQSIPRDAFCHGRDMSGNPKTWTGRAVTLEAWQALSDWDRHGSTGKVWNGLTRAWEPMKAGAKARSHIALVQPDES